MGEGYILAPGFIHVHSDFLYHNGSGRQPAEVEAIVCKGIHPFIQLQQNNNVRIKTGNTIFFSKTLSSHHASLNVLPLKIL